MSGEEEEEVKKGRIKKKDILDRVGTNDARFFTFNFLVLLLLLLCLLLSK